VKLYELAADAAVLDRWLDEHADAIAAADGEVPPELAALLDQSDAAMAAKVAGIVRVIRNHDAAAVAAKAEAARLSAVAKARAGTVESLKRYLATSLGIAGMPKVVTDVGTVSVQNNPPAVAFTVPASPAPDFPLAEFVVETAPARGPEYGFDRARALAAWKAAHAEPDPDVREATLATLRAAGLVVTVGTSVRIR
jgi:hypothetical protein